jgi:hypothetical protein
MSNTTGPILATGAVTIANKVIFTNQPMDWRVPIATGLAAIGFSMFERAAPQIADLLAWTTLITVLVTRTDPKVPSPAENAVAWWNSNQKSKPTGGVQAL